MLETESKERQSQSPGRGKKIAKALATSSGMVSQVATRITKTNSAYIEKVKSIHMKAQLDYPSDQVEAIDAE